MPKHKSKEILDMSIVVMTLIKANIMAYVVTAIFILFGSILLTYTNVSCDVENWLVMLGIILSSFLAGFDTAKVEARNGYKWGVIGGALYFVLFLILGTLTGSLKTIAPGNLFLIVIVVILSSAIAGIVSVNFEK